jgi:nucleosome assembly protein 1-like 1
MCANNHISSAIHEKDRPILGYLQDIKLDQHNDGYGFDLVFQFEKNSYFKETELKKSFIMCKQNVIEKCIGTPITWMPGCDVTKTKKKKGKGKKKTMVTVKCESFFNFFETVETEQKPKKPADDDDEEEGGEEAEQMDEDFDLGTTFRDDLIPLALEYYLGVIEQDQGGEDEDDMDGDDDEDDDEEDEKPKKSKPAPKKGGNAQGGAPAGDGKQECKQQ